VNEVYAPVGGSQALSVFDGINLPAQDGGASAFAAFDWQRKRSLGRKVVGTLQSSGARAPAFFLLTS
jgi:hypothetical protein